MRFTIIVQSWYKILRLVDIVSICTSLSFFLFREMQV
ncbi:DUF1622 domain-containing protein [Mucilaginibacter robiniae]|uniref:DUF1622 domain-containing protein n=1 Tax=Mucilaginibacter robiniae TaxID=2728022 RepID=A0A7L5E3S9_9SPHI|nr:DUF1622 domain-containing protein [Mucilaginibacter robiniae]